MSECLSNGKRQLSSKVCRNPFPDAALVSKTNQCYQACGSNNDCINRCATIFVKGDGTTSAIANDSLSNGSNNGTTAVSKLKYSSGVITSASTLVLAAFTFH